MSFNALVAIKRAALQANIRGTFQVGHRSGGLQIERRHDPVAPGFHQRSNNHKSALLCGNSAARSSTSD